MYCWLFEDIHAVNLEALTMQDIDLQKLNNETSTYLNNSKHFYILFVTIKCFWIPIYQ